MDLRRSMQSIAAVVLVAAALATVPRADAAANLCATGVACEPASDLDRTLTDLVGKLQHGADARADRDPLSDQEYFSFSGVGVIACSIDGKQHTATAFLVGAFDIGVTVGHAFEDDGR